MKKSFVLFLLGLGAACGLQAASVVMYGTIGVGGSPSTLVRLDPATGGLLQTIGSVGYAVNGLEWANGKLYATTSDNDTTAPRYLIEINPSTGAGTPIGQLDPSNPVVALTSDSSGNLYGWIEPSQDDLATINATTGQATRVGESGLGTSTLGLAFDGNDNLFLVNYDGAVYSINPGTGAATSLYNVATKAHHGDFNPADGLYYGIDDKGTGSKNLEVLNLSLSSGSVVATLPTVDNLHTVTFAVIPEPSDYALGSGVALLGLALWRRGRRGLHRS